MVRRMMASSYNKKIINMLFVLQGRPRRVKTRAPTRPITDQSQDIDEGMV